MQQKITPKLLTILQEGYALKTFLSDLTSGLVVGIVALPLAIAFAIASGVKPEQGLYTAIIAGFIIAMLGGSRVQVSGPTGAFIVVVYAIVQEFGYAGLATATFMAGILLVIMGITQMGVLLRFIPYPVTVGFTSGIAVIIFSSQIKDFFGLPIDSVPAAFVDKWILYAQYFSTVNVTALGIGIVSLLIVFISPRMSSRMPGSLVAIIVMTLLVVFFGVPVETIGSRYGSVPTMLPSPELPLLNLEMIRELFPAALTIAFLGAIESLLSAVVADGMMGTRHRSNTELIAQGIGNIISPIFGGIPATGAIARTAVNVKNGGKTPVAAMFHSVVLLLIMLLFGKWATLIPMPTLAAILIFVAYNMSEWHTFKRMLRAPKSDVSVLLTTFFLTVLVDLTVAIEVGVVLAAFLFLNRMQRETGMERFIGEFDEVEDQNPISKKIIPPGVEVFELFGPLFYGVAERFKNSMKRVENPPRVLILRMRQVPVIDASGIHALEEIYAQCLREGTKLIISSLRAQPLRAIEKSEFIQKLGVEHIQPTIDAALEKAKQWCSREDS